MLNEIKEFEQYSMPIDAFLEPAERRLKYTFLISKKFSGLERAMVTIARWYIFKDDDTGKSFNENDVIEVLKTWCGFKTQKDIPGTEFLKGWLNLYIRNVFLAEKVQECKSKLASSKNDLTDLNKLAGLIQTISLTDSVETLTNTQAQIEAAIKNLKKTNLEIDNSIIEKVNSILFTITALENLENRKKTFAKSLYADSYQIANRIPNTIKIITYERIIANALLKGKLEQYYMLCDIDPFKTNMIRKNKNPNLKMKESDKDLVLRITALYLLQKAETVQDYVLFNQIDLANWLLKKANPQKFELEKYKINDYSEPLFRISTPNSSVDGDKIGNTTKIKVHPEWVKRFKIIKAQDLDKPENQGQIFFSDPGCGDYLQQNVKY